MGPGATTAITPIWTCPDGRGIGPMNALPSDLSWSYLRVWRHNRELYPGWVVAPPNVREWIWDHTREFLHTLATQVTNLEPRERLASLFELNWRLEICLCPIWNDLVPVYE